MDSSPTDAPPLRGFLLTRDWHDTREGSELTFWALTDGGARKIVLTGQPSAAFVRRDEREAAQRALGDLAAAASWRSVELKTFAQAPVDALYLRGHRRMLTARRRLEEHGIELLEADVRPTDRYLMERFITGSVWIDGGTHQADGTIVNPRLRPGDGVLPPVRTVALDIETSAHGDLYSLALYGCGASAVWMLDPTRDDTLDLDGMTLTYCRDRASILHALNHWVDRNDPDIFTGWNLVQFDLQQLQACSTACGVPLRLGRDGAVLELRGHQRRDGYVFATLPGRLAVDGIEAMKAAMWNFRSYSLEAVAQELLGEGKDIADKFTRLAQIEQRFREDKPALARYNLKDCVLTQRIFEHAKLIEFLLERANVTGLQPDHMGGSIAAFSHLYLPRMHRAGYVAPSVHRRHEPPYPGGFVLDSRPGLYDSVLVLDYKSLYPSILRTYLVDPVGLAEGMASSDVADTVPGPNGTRFSRSNHCLPEIIREIWQRRDAAKRAGNTAQNVALKVLMNAFVGVLGSPDARFYDGKLVSAVTLRGHDIVQRTQRLVEEQGFDVIYGDTDSLFIWLGRRYADDEARATADRLVAAINAWWTAHLRDTLGLASYLEIEFDTHYQRFFMPTIRGRQEGSKKRYAGLAVNDDGSTELVFRGMETARSDWTPLAQTFQQRLFALVFDEAPHLPFVEDYVRRLRAGELDDQLVYRKRVRSDLTTYDRITPPAVRAARLADAQNERLGRPLQYQGGGWIEYVMTVNGPEPVEYARSPLDREHYVTHQLAPIADAILGALGQRFDAATAAQAELGF